MQQCRKGFTLIELLIVLAIIGIISAMAIPNLQNALHRARISRAKADLKAISLALELYRIDYGFVPYFSQIVPISEMPELFMYMKSSTEDGWGHPYSYYTDGEGTHYFVGSRGADGYWDGFSGPPDWETPENFKSYRCKMIEFDDLRNFVRHGCDIKYIDGGPLF